MLSLAALGTLDPAEAQALEQHLASCADCSAELEEWRDTSAALAYAAAPVAPSPAVRARVLESIRAEAQDGKHNVVPLARPRKSQPATAGWSRAAQAIAAVLVLAFLVGLLVLWSKTVAMRATITQLNQQLLDTSARLEHERKAIEVLTTPGAKMRELAGTKEAPAAHAMLAMDKSGHAVFMARGLPQAPAGKAYQLWFIAGAKPMPGKVFKTDSTGNAMMMDEQIPADALAAGTFAVTLEPQEGVSSPTGAMYLLSPG